MRALHVHVPVEHDEARRVRRLVGTVVIGIDVLAVRRHVLDAREAVVAVVEPKRLAERLQRLGIELAVPVAAIRLGLCAGGSEPHIQNAVETCYSVRRTRKRNLLDEVQLLVEHLYAPTSLPGVGMAQRRIQPPFPKADVASMAFDLDTLYQVPAPVRLHDLRMVGKVKRIGVGAHPLHVTAPRLADEFLDGSSLRQARIPARHLPAFPRQIDRTAPHRHDNRHG